MTPQEFMLVGGDAGYDYDAGQSIGVAQANTTGEGSASASVTFAGGTIPNGTAELFRVDFSCNTGSQDPNWSKHVRFIVNDGVTTYSQDLGYGPGVGGGNSVSWTFTSTVEWGPGCSATVEPYGGGNFPEGTTGYAFVTAEESA